MPRGATPAEPLPGPQELDLSPWLLRRLALATELAAQMHADAQAVLATLATAVPAMADMPGTAAQGGPAPAQNNPER